ncbi:MAG: hypothetical protein NTY35_10780 [Planctomycetota bacterium]|nr:hypothetical protein [Planctomycetota bacterium]
MDAKTLNKLRFHLERLVHGTADDPEEEWRKLGGLVRDALASPAHHESVELRRLLEDFARRIPERRLVDNVYALQSELGRVAKSGAHRVEKPRGPLSPTQQVAELLRGRVMLVIGGDPRHQHAERLRVAFELSEVLWPETSETNPSVSFFEPSVARPEVAIVLLLIKLNRHGVTEELPAVCERHGKAVVRMVGGYHPDQVAEQILKQVGKRLGGPAA